MEYKIVHLLYSFLLAFYIIHTTNSEVRICGNPDCQAIISEGKTIQRYPSPHKNILSCKIDEVVQIYGKSIGDKGDLWDVQINSRRGLLPSRYIKEETIIIRPEKLIQVSSKEGPINDSRIQSSKTVAITGNDIDYNNLVEHSHSDKAPDYQESNNRDATSDNDYNPNVGDTREMPNESSEKDSIPLVDPNSNLKADQPFMGEVPPTGIHKSEQNDVSSSRGESGENTFQAKPPHMFDSKEPENLSKSHSESEHFENLSQKEYDNSQQQFVPRDQFYANEDKQQHANNNPQQQVAENMQQQNANYNHKNTKYNQQNNQDYNQEYNQDYKQEYNVPYKQQKNNDYDQQNERYSQPQQTGNYNQQQQHFGDNQQQSNPHYNQQQQNTGDNQQQSSPHKQEENAGDNQQQRNQYYNQQQNAGDNQQQSNQYNQQQQAAGYGKQQNAGAIHQPEQNAGYEFQPPQNKDHNIHAPQHRDYPFQEKLAKYKPRYLQNSHHNPQQQNNGKYQKQSYANNKRKEQVNNKQKEHLDNNRQGNVNKQQENIDMHQENINHNQQQRQHSSNDPKQANITPDKTSQTGSPKTDNSPPNHEERADVPELNPSPETSFSTLKPDSAVGNVTTNDDILLVNHSKAANSNDLNDQIDHTAKIDEKIEQKMREITDKKVAELDSMDERGSIVDEKLNETSFIPVEIPATIHTNGAGSIPKEDTKFNGGSIPKEDTKSDDGSIPKEDTKSDDGSIPKEDTKSDDGSIPKEDTKSDDGSIPKEDTKSDDGSIPKEDTKSDDGSIPKEDTKSNDGAKPQRDLPKDIPVNDSNSEGVSEKKIPKDILLSQDICPPLDGHSPEKSKEANHLDILNINKTTNSQADDFKFAEEKITGDQYIEPVKVDDLRDKLDGFSSSRSPLESHEPKIDSLPIDEENSTEDQPSLYVIVTEYILNTLKPILGDDIGIILEMEMFQSKMSIGAATLLLIISGTILMLYLIHLCVMKMSNEAPMLKEMNNIKREMRFTVDENMTLKNKLSHTSVQSQHDVLNSIDSSAVDYLQNELMNTKETYAKVVQSYEEKVQQIELELDESTSNGMEMHKMLDELLQSQKDSTNFQASVDSLQMKLDTHKDKVETLTTDLAMKTHFNDELRIELKSSKDKIFKLDHQIEQLSRSLNEANASMADASKELKAKQLQINKLEEMKLSSMKEVENAKVKMNHLKERGESLQLSLKETKVLLNLKDAEILVSKECCKKLQKSGNKNINLAELFDVIELKRNLKVAENYKSRLEKELELFATENEDVSKNLREIEEKIDQYRSDCEKACRERDDSESKLKVLTDYFKQKENKLVKELESQEHLRIDAEGSFAGIETKMQNYEIESSSYRSQIEALMAEIQDQQQSYKMQLNSEEKKSQENWIAARTSERRMDELRKENGQLRQRLTSMGRDDGQNMMLKPLPIRMEANGNASSPASTDGDLDRSLNPQMELNHLHPMPHHILPPMFPSGPPLPPPPFMGVLPPPPGRLPPAGRIASPSFRRRSSPPRYERGSYSPSSDYSNYSDRCYSPPSGRYSPGRRTSPERSRQRRDHMQNHVSPPLSRMPMRSPPQWYPSPNDRNPNPLNYSGDRHHLEKGDKQTSQNQNER